jgi:ketosteroid isomerase-like protein
LPRRFVAAAAVGQDQITPALTTLADAERAFAKAATQKGIRDSFLEFFADDAVALVPEPASWKERLKARPAVPFSEHELVWEPRLGDIAASGELGWLTGPSTFTDRKEGGAPRYGNYLSVWRKEASRAWKVFLDIGSDSPVAVPFAPGFNRFEFGSRYTGAAGKAAATASLLERDRWLNSRIPHQGAATAYAPVLSSQVRLHRDGMAAVTGHDAAVEWIKQNTPSFTAVSGAAESARSGDLGYSYGTVVLPSATAKASYMRLWSRTPEGLWLIVVEVMSPAAK